MNFLSHYYALKEEDAYFILGTVMPDIVHDFSKIHNQFIQDKYFPEGLAHVAMLAGVKNHIKADDVFHNHSLFDKMQQVAKQHMKSTFGETVKRQFIIAHVLIELMIDQYIIENYREVLEEFYLKLDEIDVAEANLFFKNLTVEENSSYFKRNFTNFRELKFLFHLKENEGIIFTLNKVFSRRLQYNFEEEKQKWNNTIDLIKEDVAQYIPIILEDVKTRLYE